MLQWLSANWGTMLVGAVLLTILALIVRSMSRRKSGCCGDCEKCRRACKRLKE